MYCCVRKIHGKIWSPPNHPLSLSVVEPKVSNYWHKKTNILNPICFYKQTHCTRAVIDKKGRQTNTLHYRIDTKVKYWLISINKPVISCSLILRRPRSFGVPFASLPLPSWWSLRTLKQLWQLKQILAIWAVLRTTVIVSKACKEVKMGNSLQ